MQSNDFFKSIYVLFSLHPFLSNSQKNFLNKKEFKAVKSSSALKPISLYALAFWKAQWWWCSGAATWALWPPPERMVSHWIALPKDNKRWQAHDDTKHMPRLILTLVSPVSFVNLVNANSTIYLHLFFILLFFFPIIVPRYHLPKRNQAQCYFSTSFSFWYHLTK